MPAARVRRGPFSPCQASPQGLRLARTAVAGAIFTAALASFPGTTWAQTDKALPEAATCGNGVPITDKVCQKEFDDWQKREKRWRDNRRVYANYVTYKGLRAAPKVWRLEPPQWIAGHCEPELAAEVSRLSQVCEAYDDYLRYDWAQHIEGPSAGVTYVQRQAVATTADQNRFVDYLLKNLHYDGAWTNSENGPRVIGMFGTHLTFGHASRLFFWGPPGALVLRRPEGKIEIKMTYGLDVFLADIPLPFSTGYKLPLYFSVAKVFNTNEKKALERGLNAGMDMIGFSVTLKR